MVFYPMVYHMVFLLVYHSVFHKNHHKVFHKYCFHVYHKVFYDAYRKEDILILYLANIYLHAYKKYIFYNVLPRQPK